MGMGWKGWKEERRGAGFVWDGWVFGASVIAGEVGDKLDAAGEVRMQGRDAFASFGL